MNCRSGSSPSIWWPCRYFIRNRRKPRHNGSDSRILRRADGTDRISTQRAQRPQRKAEDFLLYPFFSVVSVPSVLNLFVFDLWCKRAVPARSLLHSEDKNLS